MKLTSMSGSKKLIGGSAAPTAEALIFLRELIEANGGHKKGDVVISV